MFALKRNDTGLKSLKPTNPKYCGDCAYYIEFNSRVRPGTCTNKHRNEFYVYTYTKACPEHEKQRWEPRGYI